MQFSQKGTDLKNCSCDFLRIFLKCWTDNYETTQIMTFVDFSRGIFEKMEAKNHLIRWFSHYLRRGIVENHGFQVDGSGKMTRRYFWKFRKVLTKHRYQLVTILNVIWPTVFQKKHSTNYGITLCTFGCASRVVDLTLLCEFPRNCMSWPRWFWAARARRAAQPG